MAPKRAQPSRKALPLPENQEAKRGTRSTGHQQTHIEPEHIDSDEDEVAAESSADTRASKKKAKKGPVRYLCITCDTNRQAKFFPDYNPTCECKHLINTCTACLKKWVAGQVEGAKTVVLGKEEQKGDEKLKQEKKGGEGADDKEDKEERNGLGIRCPECEMVMKNSDVQMAATIKVYARFNELERRHIADSDPNWRWCLNPSCDHGQIHITASDPTPRKPALATRRKLLFVSTPEHESANLPQDNCTCDECGSIACVPCDRPWHEGESCAEFQVRVKNRMDEEDQSLALIRKAMKKCPECSRSIEKNGGCPSMHCSQCGASFCWNCLKTYTRGLCGCGRGQT